MTREEHFKNIYDKANKLMQEIGIHGAVTIRDNVSTELMDVMAEFDGGEWNNEKMFPGVSDENKN